MTQLQHNTYWLPKAGSAAQEYEDAFAHATRAGSFGRELFAVADGATESILSKQWANFLVKRFVRDWTRPDQVEPWLTMTLRAWQNEKRKYIAWRERAQKPIQWYEEPGLEAGAFAALLGLVLTRTPYGFSWHAAACGDCCLALVSDNRVESAFPLQAADDFSNRPFLLSSNAARNGKVMEQLQLGYGSLLSGERMYLMTDALAAWFLRAAQDNAQPWNILDALRAPDAFYAWVVEKRAARELRNDDVTLIRLICE